MDPDLEFRREKVPHLVGKYVIIALDEVDSDGNVLARSELHGRIVGAVESKGVYVELRGRSAGETFTLPPCTESFINAPPGRYRLRSTGELVAQPDLIAHWSVIKSLPGPGHAPRSAT